MRKGEIIRDEISFNGIDGLESPEFIQALRVKAFDEDKAEDPKYLALMASMCFTGPALRWFENLSDNIQTDWSLLRRALLARFPALDADQGGAPSPYLIFAGGSPEACEEFVSNVRRHTYAEGKSRDDQWAADYAGSCMVKDALRWHTKLDAPLRNSWVQLEHALLTYFPDLPPSGLEPIGKAVTERSWTEEEKWLQESRERQAAYDTAAPGVYPVDGSIYVVRCKATNTFLDNYDGLSTVGNKIVWWTHHTAGWQKWKLTKKPNSDQYCFISLPNGMALGCADALTPCVPCTMQNIPTYFQIIPLGEGLYSFCVPLTNYRLDLLDANPARGTKTVLSPDHGGLHQQFYLDRY